MAHTVEDMLRSAFRRCLFRSLTPNLYCGMLKRRWREARLLWEKNIALECTEQHQTDHGSTRCLSSWFLRTCLIVIEAVCDFTGDTFFCRWSYMVLVPRHPWRPAGFFFRLAGILTRKKAAHLRGWSLACSYLPKSVVGCFFSPHFVLIVYCFSIFEKSWGSFVLLPATYFVV